MDDRTAGTAETAPPPPPPPAPPQQWAVPSDRTTTPGTPRRPWRDRLPELVGGIGTVLVLAAIIGFVSATWEDLDRYGRSLVLLGASGGITAAALFVEQRDRERLAALSSMLWLAGAGTLAASVTLATVEALDGRMRVAIAIGGLVGAAHALVASRRAPGSALRQVGVVGALVYAAGPFGTAVTDGFGVDDLWTAVEAVGALVVRDLASDDYLLTGALHLMIGAGWLLWATRTTGTASRVAWVGSTVLVTFAALELHALPSGIGAFGALLVVLGYLVFGLVTDRAGAVAIGVAGGLVAGSRVLWSLFSGEVATTVASFTVGLALLAWAVRARAADEERGTDAASTPVGR